jgi:hypothetical protein
MAAKQTYLDWVQSLDVDDEVQIAQTSGLGRAQRLEVICLYARVTGIQPDGRIRVRHFTAKTDLLFAADGHGATALESGTAHPNWLLWEEGREPW